MEKENAKQRVLSGIQPTGTFTLGNYIGAVRNWPLLQDDSRPACPYGKAGPCPFAQAHL